MANAALIYVVEDDDSIRMLLSMALKSAGYGVQEFTNADAALARLETEIPDAMLLDVMMDGTDGVSAMRIVRSSDRLSRLPVMMLTARDGETDKVVGLDAGADDYMTKPFGVLELCARVRALLRRGQSKSEEQELSTLLISGDLKLNLSVYEATKSEKVVELTFKEFELLRTLMQAAPAALSREALLQQVWGFDFVGETRTLDMHIGTLRAKLGEDVAQPQYIKTVRGVGYRFLKEVHSS